MTRVIYQGSRKLYYFDTYESNDKLWKIIHRYKKRNNKLKYQIIKREKGYLFPYIVYDLYFDKVIRLAWY